MVGLTTWQSQVYKIRKVGFYLFIYFLKCFYILIYFYLAVLNPITDYYCKFKSNQILMHSDVQNGFW